MIGIIIRKASPVGTQIVPDATIEIVGACPRFNDLNDAAHFYDGQAQKLAIILFNTLPGGVLDRLLAKMLIHKASHFVIPSWDTGEVVRNDRDPSEGEGE